MRSAPSLADDDMDRHFAEELSGSEQSAIRQSHRGSNASREPRYRPGLRPWRLDAGADFLIASERLLRECVATPHLLMQPPATDDVATQERLAQLLFFRRRAACKMPWSA